MQTSKCVYKFKNNVHMQHWWYVNSDRRVTRSYSSRPFLCTLALTHAATTPLARKKKLKHKSVKTQILSDSSDDMDDFDEIFMSRPTSTKIAQKRKMRRKLLVSQSEGTIEGSSSEETCQQNLSSLGQTKRPSSETPKSSIAPNSSVKKVPKSSGVICRKPSASHAKSSAKSISTAKSHEAKSYTPSPQLTTPKRKVKTGHVKRSFSLCLDSDVSNQESSTSSISDNSNVKSKKGESSEEDELPSFSAMMETYAGSTKSDQLTTPHKGTKPLKDLLHDVPAKVKTSSTNKPKKKKHLNIRHTVKQRIEKRPFAFAVKSTARKKRRSPLPPSTMDENEVIVISSDNSSSTEPLSRSPIHLQKPVPDELESESCVHREASGDLKAISAEILKLFSNENSVSGCNSKFTSKVSAVQNVQEKSTESKPVSEVIHSSSLSAEQTSNILGNSHKSITNRKEAEVPNTSEVTEWFDKDDIHGIDKVVTWLRASQEDDSQTANNPSEVNLVCDLSERVDGSTKVNPDAGALQ